MYQPNTQSESKWMNDGEREWVRAIGQKMAILQWDSKRTLQLIECKSND